LLTAFWPQARHPSAAVGTSRHIARDGRDAWNAHDVNAWLKILDEQHRWESNTLPAPLIGRDAASRQ
jgi:hypothetical protein